MTLYAFTPPLIGLVLAYLLVRFALPEYRFVKGTMKYNLVRSTLCTVIIFVTIIFFDYWSNVLGLFALGLPYLIVAMAMTADVLRETYHILTMKKITAAVPEV
ncbi:MAG: hypothetical protein ACXAEN_23090 [Candidatus Thorarchaeota archaeon]|jgi:hypothetical protein